MKSIARLLLISFGLTTVLAGCLTQAGPSATSPKGIQTYEDCLSAGGLILESYPSICEINGQSYKQDISTGKTGDKRVMRFLVEPQTVTCQGFHPVDQKCLIVNGGNFFDEIEGYTHQEGVGRILRVLRTQICNPDV